MSLPSIFIDDAEPEEDNAKGGSTTSKQYGATGVGPSALPFLGPSPNGTGCLDR